MPRLILHSHYNKEMDSIDRPTVPPQNFSAAFKIREDESFRTAFGSWANISSQIMQSCTRPRSKSSLSMSMFASTQANPRRASPRRPRREGVPRILKKTIKSPWNPTGRDPSCAQTKALSSWRCATVRRLTLYKVLLVPSPELPRVKLSSASASPLDLPTKTTHNLAQISLLL